MDLKHPTTKIPQTPPHSLLTFTNGNTHHHSTYKECLKNHAVGIGRYAVDGCGEFMSLEPSSFQCAACGCHRNFHRREPITRFITATVAAAGTSTSPSLSPPPSPGQHLILSLGTVADHNHPVAAPDVIKNSGRKRFRTKFSPEQKLKMLDFAEKVGWKMQRCDDKMIVDFCNEIGIRRRILKVWMHNNKNTKRDTTATTSANPDADAGNTVDGGNQENGSSSSS